MYVVALTGAVAVLIVNVDSPLAPLYIFNPAAFAFVGVKIICGAVPNDTLKVMVDNIPIAAQLVPVNIVTVPTLSLPTTDTVGVVQAAAPAAIVGLTPPVTI